LVIDKSLLSADAYRGILIDNILRNADAFDGDLEREIEKADARIVRGEWVLLYSQVRQQVTIVDKAALNAQ